MEDDGTFIEGLDASGSDELSDAMLGNAQGNDEEEEVQT